MSLVIAAKSEARKEFARAVLSRFADAIPGGPILVKPNVVSPEPYPTTTHPDLLSAVLEYYAGRELTVADAAAADLVRPGKALREHPLAEVCRAHGRELLDLYDHPMTKLKAPSGVALTMSELPLKSSAIVSLPVLKSHVQCLMTGALKNHFGFLPRRERGRLHCGRGDIHQAIASLHQLAPVSLVIMDAVITEINANEIRHGGKPAPLGYLLAATDPVALDAFALSLLQTVEPKLHGLSPREIPYLRYAAEWGVGSLQYELEWI